MKKRNVLNSPHLAELRKRRRRIFGFKITLYLLVFVVFIFSIVYASRSSVLNISSIEIVGNKIIDTEVLKETIQQQITGNYLYFFPKTNILFYPKNHIKNDLQNKFKRLKDISLSIKNQKILVVSFNEREALYTWCGNVLPDINESAEKCYFLDNEGYIFDEAPYFSGEVYFKFYGFINADTMLGSYFASESFQSFISFKKILEMMDLKPVALYMTSLGDIKIFLSKGATMSMGPMIVFKMDADFQKIEENLQTILTTEPLQSTIKNKPSSIEYIDLRYGNKVYFKSQ